MTDAESYIDASGRMEVDGMETETCLIASILHTTVNLRQKVSILVIV